MSQSTGTEEGGNFEHLWSSLWVLARPFVSTDWSCFWSDVRFMTKIIWMHQEIWKKKNLKYIFFFTFNDSFFLCCYYKSSHSRIFSSFMKNVSVCPDHLKWCCGLRWQWNSPIHCYEILPFHLVCKQGTRQYLLWAAPWKPARWAPSALHQHPREPPSCCGELHGCLPPEGHQWQRDGKMSQFLSNLVCSLLFKTVSLPLLTVRPTANF